MERIRPTRIFYVYEHWRSDKNVCFYVGKGQGRRAYYQYRNKYYNTILAKLQKQELSLIVKFVAVSLTEDEAFELEKARISFWKQAGIRLANLTDGGEGPSGRKRTPEHNAAIMAAIAGKPRPKDVCLKISKKLTGFEFSKERCENISKGHKGKRLSESHRLALSVAGSKYMASEEGLVLAQRHRERFLANRVTLGKDRPYTIQRRKRKMPPSFGEAISKSRLGMKFTDEHKRRLSEAKLGKKRKPFKKSTRRRMQIAARRRERKKRLLYGAKVTRKSRIKGMVIPTELQL